MKVYTGSGLRRAKPYIHFLVLYYRGIKRTCGRFGLHMLSLEGCPGRLILASDLGLQVGFHLYPSRSQYGRLIRAALIRLDYLDMHAKFSSCIWTRVLGRRVV
jgi:hypothetical protein